MVWSRRSVSSVLAATVVAVLTLLVFAIEQFAGPEGVVQRFQAIARRAPGASDAELRIISRDLQKLLIQDLRQSTEANELVALTVELMAGDPEMRVVRTLDNALPGDSNSFAVDIFYRAPGGRVASVVWILRRDRRAGWKIDAVETRNFMRARLR